MIKNKIKITKKFKFEDIDEDDMFKRIASLNLVSPGSSKEDPGNLQDYLPNICHDLRQMI